MTCLLEVKNITKNFKNVQVLKGVNLQIHKGEVISIIGPSGSGKSTFLRCLNLLEIPQSGTIKFNDEIIFNLDNNSNEVENILNEIKNENDKAKLKKLNKILNKAMKKEEKIALRKSIELEKSIKYGSEPMSNAVLGAFQKLLAESTNTYFQAYFEHDFGEINRLLQVRRRYTDYLSRKAVRQWDWD